MQQQWVRCSPRSNALASLARLALRRTLGSLVPGRRRRFRAGLEPAASLGTMLVRPPTAESPDRSDHSREEHDPLAAQSPTNRNRRVRPFQDDMNLLIHQKTLPEGRVDGRDERWITSSFWQPLQPNQQHAGCSPTRCRTKPRSSQPYRPWHK